MNACLVDPACPQAPTTLYLREYQTCQTSRLSGEQARALREHFGRYVSINPAWEPGAWEITAKQYVGVIVLDDFRLIIEPKVSQKNLFYMLTYAYDLPDFRREKADLDVGDDLFEFIVVIFLRQVEQLVRRGIYRAYITQKGNAPFLRGRLLLAEHLQQNAVRIQHFYQLTVEFTADVLENQILKHTLWLLAQLDFHQPNMRQQIRRVASAFAEVSLAPIIPADCDRVLYTRLNAAYRSRINLARLLMQHLSLEGRAGGIQFASYLFDMNKVFELFVARFLESHLAAHPSIQVDIQPEIWLDDEQKEQAIPDIILRIDGQRRVVLDTKYKVFDQRPAAADRNQMHVYCQALGLSRGILVYANDQPIHYGTRIAGVDLNAQSLSLDGSLAEFEDRCRAFANEFTGSVLVDPGV